MIYISHRLQELWEIADTVTVLRDGKFVGKKNIGEVDHKGIPKPKKPPAQTAGGAL